MKYFKLFIILILIVSIPTIFVLKDRENHKKDITIATGSKYGGYYKYAKEYKKLFKKYGINLKIVTTKGSIDAQLRLIKNQVDFAFVQGGTEITKHNIQALANVDYEPIWIFCSDKNIISLQNLIGKRVAIGEKGSGIYPVAKKLLHEVGIDDKNSKLLNLKSSDAAFELQAKTLDAMFYIASAKSKLIKKLLINSDISLMNFQNANAFKQYFIVKNEKFNIVKLYPSSLDIKNNIPTKEHTLLAKTTLIATKNGSDEMVRLFMKILTQVHNKAGFFNKEKEFPNEAMMKFPQHEASQNYFQQPNSFYEKYFDYWTAQSLMKLHNFVLLYFLPFLTIFGFFIEVVIPAFELYSRRKVIKWYGKINEIDTGIEKFTLQEAIEKRKVVEDMLHKIRSQDDIPSTHMEEFYTLQNQVSSILKEIQNRIDELKKNSKGFKQPSL